MKNKILVILSLCLLLTGFTLAQEKPTKTIHTHFKAGKIIETEKNDSEASAQATKWEKPRIYILNCFTIGEEGGVETIGNCLKLADFTTIYFWTELFALLKTQLRLTIIFLGPEYFVYTSDWMTWEKHECAFYGVTIDPAEWKKGVYTIIWFAETKEATAGIGLKKQCIVRFY